MFNKYYQDELSFLRELGAEFAKIYPEAAPMLAHPGTDPDVERLLEGFAFLSARIRQKLDDELPEFTHGILEMLAPHYLRPVPSMAIVQFDPEPSAAREIRRIPRNAEIDSKPVDGTACRFRIANDVTMLPLQVTGVSIFRDVPPSMTVKFRVLEPASLAKIRAENLPLRIFLHGDHTLTRGLYLGLRRLVKRVYAKVEGQSAPIALPKFRIEPVGFGENDALLGYPKVSFPGFRLLQEYFSLPAKFLFLDLYGIGDIAASANAFELTFEFTRLQNNLPTPNADSVRLNCAPVVNIFKHDADPIRLDHTRTDYRIRPGGLDPSHYEIYSIESVRGLVRGSGKTRDYRPIFRLSQSGQDKLFYRVRAVPSVTAEGTENYISFISTDAAVTDIETITIELTSTNRQLPSKLQVGDISAKPPAALSFVKYRNITRPTSSVPPPLGDDTYWRLLSHMSLNYFSLLHLDSLKSVLGLYHFQARVNRDAEQVLKQILDGISGLKASPSTRLIDGAAVRGTTVELELNEDNFGGEGSMYLFASVLNEFFTQYAGINSFTRLIAKGVWTKETYEWAPRQGRRSGL